jgi:hypothetical protein
MKILLDENLPVELKLEFSDTNHKVFTVKDMLWTGKKNGELLKLFSENSFEVFITLDKNLEKQQNIAKYNFPIIIINALNNKIETLLPFMAQLKKILQPALISGITMLNI